MIWYLKKGGEGNERTAYSEENERDEQHETCKKEGDAATPSEMQKMRGTSNMNRVRRRMTQLHPLK